MGEYLAGPLYGKEGILLADLDLDLIGQALFDFDVMGHYARPDVFQLIVNTEDKRSARMVNGCD
jgi:nitrilase